MQINKQEILKSFFQEEYIKSYYQDYRVIVELKYPFISPTKELVKQIGNYIEVRPNLLNLKDKDLVSNTLENKYKKYKINSFNGEITIFDQTLEKHQILDIYQLTGYIAKYRSSFLSKTCKQIQEIYYKNLHNIFKFRRKISDKINSDLNSSSEFITITFLGGTGQVGRSCYLIKTYNSSIIIESGLIAKSNQSYTFPILNFYDLNLQDLDAIVISHAHLDHGGFLPAIYNAGYSGPVYMTKPTQAFLVAQHLDLIKLNSNSHIFSINDIKSWVKNTILLPYHRCIKISNDIKMVFQPANHLLGASMIYLTIGKKQILFTGDYKYNEFGILPKIKLRRIKIDTLISEATYANLNRKDQTYQQAKQKIIKLINDTYQKQGHLLIPTLSMGRSQEIILLINDIIQNKLVPCIPVYIQGSITQTTLISQDFKSYYNHTLNIDFTKLSENFEFKPLDNYEKSCVIITTSGMFEGGPILKHLVNLANRPKTTILINTAQITNLGKKIKQKETQIIVKQNNIQTQIELNAKIQITNYFSGHSTELGLYKFIKLVKSNRVILVHCDYQNARIFSKKIKSSKQVYVPKLLESLRLD
jgi:predicted metal-dependent RNase